jgi:glucokinase
VNIVSPEAVIVGGGLIGAWDILAKEAKKEAERRAFPQLIEKTHILPATLGEDAGLLGAAYLALKFNETEI